MKTTFTAQEKTAVLKRLMLDDIPVPAICAEYNISPHDLKKWRERFFEGGAQALEYAERAKTKPARTLWHRLLARLLKELLTPLNIEVYSGIPVMTHPPEADIVIIRRKGERWTPEQRAVLPDGVRDVASPYIIIEFKYSQSVNERAFRQTLNYDSLYKSSQDLNHEEVQTFLVSSKSPLKKVLAEAGYSATGKRGVYKTDAYILNSIILMDLNKLSDEPHNAFIKCFASHKKQKTAAFKTLTSMGLDLFSNQVRWIVQGLNRLLLHLKGENHMNLRDIEVTPESLIEFGKLWGDDFIKNTPIEKLLEGIPDKKRLEGIPVKKRLEGIPAKKRLEGIPVKKRLEGVPYDEVLEEIPMKKRLEGIPPQALKAYLEKLKKEGLA